MLGWSRYFFIKRSLLNHRSLLSRWVWVLQIFQAIWVLVAITGQRWPSNAPSFLLFSATLLVMNTLICRDLLGMHSYSQMEATVWDNVAVAGFCTAAATQYLFIFFGPAHYRAFGAESKHGRPMAQNLEL